jgi:hypothetical protein
MSRLRFLWLHITGLFSSEDQDILVDGISRSKVSSKREQDGPFH